MAKKGSMNNGNSGKKDNFYHSFSEMFGVGNEEAPEEAVKETVQAPNVMETLFEGAPAAPVKDSRTTYLAVGTSMEGTLQSDADVEIAGNFKGDIISAGAVTLHSNIQGNVTAERLTVVNCSLTGDVKTTGQVVISSGSTVTGNILARDLVCSGQVNGDMDIKENVTLDEQACINGSISTGTMSMARGAVISGALKMACK